MARHTPVASPRILSAAMLAVVATVWMLPPANAITPFPSSEPNIPRSGVSFCIEAVPPLATDDGDPLGAGTDAFDPALAEVHLQTAISTWNAVLGYNGGSALDLSYVPGGVGCSADVIITSLFIEVPARTLNGLNYVVMSSGFIWEDHAVNPRNPAHYSYLGVLTHEMGHVLGLSHVGGINWSPLDGKRPSLTDIGGSGKNTWRARVLSADEYGGASWVEGGGLDFWTTDPGFEHGAQWWKEKDGAFPSSLSKFTGSLGMNLPSLNSRVLTLSTYDPWLYGDWVHGDTTINARANFRNVNSSGDLTMWIRDRAFDYSQFVDENFNGSRDANEDRIQKHGSSLIWGNWTSFTEVAVCDASPNWTTCAGSNYSVPKVWSVTPPSELFFGRAYSLKVKFQNDGSGRVDLDRAGIWGGYVR